MHETDVTLDSKLYECCPFSMVSSLRVPLQLPDAASLNHMSPTNTTSTYFDSAGANSTVGILNPHPKLSNKISSSNSATTPTSPRPCASDLTGRH